MSSSILFPTNEYATSNKSSQEIQRLMMPEGANSQLDALIYIFNKGHPLQQPYAYRNFHLYPEQLLSLACSRLNKQDVQNQILISESLKTLLLEPVKQVKNQYVVTIFDSAIQALANWNTINNQHLIEIVSVSIEVSKQKQELLKKLEKTILEMGKASQPIISKVISGRLIPVYLKHTGKVIRGEMIDIVKRIITDSEVQAKKVWVNEIFPKLLENLKLELIQLHLQQKIYQTVYDQNQEIGLMALEVILRNATKFSIEQQGSRIVKLFIDSLTSKNEKIALMASSFMGQTYQKLQNIIIKNEAICLKFWKSLIQVAQSKNQKILANFIFNLPGILYLSKKYHKVDPICEVYTQLFYNSDADTFVLISYFHQMVQMFPSKLKLLRETAYTLFSESFQTEGQKKDTDAYQDQTMKILDCLICHLYEAKDVFLFQEQENDESILTAKNITGTIKTQNNAKGHINGIQDQSDLYFDSVFTQNLQRYLHLCLQKKNGNYLKNLYQSIFKCNEYFSPQFTQNILLPKLYAAIRGKTAHLRQVVKILVIFLSRDVSSNSLINNYASKVNIQLSKSNKSHQRQAAMYFFYHCSQYFSIELFQQFKLGQKFLQFHNQKILKNKIIFIQFLARLIYFFSKQEKIQFTIILNKLRKDTDPQIQQTIQKTNFIQNEELKQRIVAKSIQLKQKQKSRGNNHHHTHFSINSKKTIFPKRETKQLKKEDVLKKRVQTKSKTKMLIKEIPKKRTPMVVRPMLKKT